MALIDYHGVPVTGTELLDQASTRHAVDGGEQVAVLVWGLATGENFAKLWISQHFAIGAKRLAQDFFAMRNKQQPRGAPDGVSHTSVIKGGDDGFPSASSSNDQVSIPPVRSFVGELLQHR